MGKKEIKGQLVCTKVEQEFLDELDFYAKKLGLTRSQLMRNIMRSGLDDLKVLYSTGALALISKGIDLFTLVKESLRLKKYRVEKNEVIISIGE